MFPHFKQLPREIRAAIWKLAFGGGHIVSTEALKHTPPPEAALANTESWAEYTRQPFIVTLGGGRVYFNPETDIVVYSRLDDYNPWLGDARLQNDIHREYRRHVATTTASQRNLPPPLPQPIVNPHPRLNTAMIITAPPIPTGQPPRDRTRVPWDIHTRNFEVVIQNHYRDPVMKIPKALIRRFPALETLWRAGNSPWSCQNMTSRNSRHRPPLMSFQFQYHSVTDRVLIREMPRSVRREFWGIQWRVTRSRIKQPTAYMVVAAIHIVRDRDISPADMADGWRTVQTFEEEAALGRGGPKYDLLPNRLWWMLLGGEIGRYIG
ncbi:hypothetical protein LX32DRAFT_681939 [Colletotrichum zoysiae]|uniref:2EXR domain-containing protein n=1 Tax=Colletotrichum zoysiae TaxID=1216348 RepID=A0AAD9M6F5_9PEZI|nr:hypothetical protein LX32DRAFT_681939 [Colletotrichum zoysiae]